MRAEEARAQLRAGNLIDRKTSKAVLNSIVRDEPCDVQLPSELLTHITSLRANYHDIRGRIGYGPRNQPFYMMIKERYSDFDWTPTDKGVTIEFKYRGIKPSLLSLLVGRVPVDGRREKPAFDRLPAPIRDKVRRLRSEIGLVATSTEQDALFVDWLIKGLDGEELTIVSPVCPDYAVEPVADDGKPGGNPGRDIAGRPAADANPYLARRHRFTFRDLGTGIGVTAAHLFRALPALHATLIDELGLKVKHLFCPGDFEGFSVETCARLGIDEEEFQRRVAGSTKAIVDTAPVPVEALLFTELCAGKPGWTALYDAILLRIESGDLSWLADESWVRETALSRKELYNRWYAVSGKPDDFYTGIAIRQAAEYAAMGQAISESPGLVNPLVLGADDHKMGHFYGLTSTLPILYFQRNYE